MPYPQNILDALVNDIQEGRQDLLKILWRCNYEENSEFKKTSIALSRAEEVKFHLSIGYEFLTETGLVLANLMTVAQTQRFLNDSLRSIFFARLEEKLEATKQLRRDSTLRENDGITFWFHPKLKTLLNLTPEKANNNEEKQQRIANKQLRQEYVDRVINKIYTVLMKEVRQWCQGKAYLKRIEEKITYWKGQYEARYDAQVKLMEPIINHHQLYIDKDYQLINHANQLIDRWMTANSEEGNEKTSAYLMLEEYCRTQLYTRWVAEHPGDLRRLIDSTGPESAVLQQRFTQYFSSEFCHHLKSTLCESPVYGEMIVNEQGDTLAHIAARCGNIAALHYMLSNRTDEFSLGHRNAEGFAFFDVADARGNTPLHYRRELGDGHIFTLLQFGASITSRNGEGRAVYEMVGLDGNPLLHAALERREIDLLSTWIKQNKIDLSIKNLQGKTLWDLISESVVLIESPPGVHRKQTRSIDFKNCEQEVLFRQLEVYIRETMMQRLMAQPVDGAAIIPLTMGMGVKEYRPYEQQLLILTQQASAYDKQIHQEWRELLLRLAPQSFWKRIELNYIKLKLGFLTEQQKEWARQREQFMRNLQRFVIEGYINQDDRKTYDWLKLELPNAQGLEHPLLISEEINKISDANEKALRKAKYAHLIYEREQQNLKIKINDFLIDNQALIQDSLYAYESNIQLVKSINIVCTNIDLPSRLLLPYKKGIEQNEAGMIETKRLSVAHHQLKINFEAKCQEANPDSFQLLKESAEQMHLDLIQLKTLLQQTLKKDLEYCENIINNFSRLYNLIQDAKSFDPKNRQTFENNAAFTSGNVFIVEKNQQLYEENKQILAKVDRFLGCLMEGSFADGDSEIQWLGDLNDFIKNLTHILDRLGELNVAAKAIDALLTFKAKLKSMVQENKRISQEIETVSVLDEASTEKNRVFEEQNHAIDIEIEQHTGQLLRTPLLNGLSNYKACFESLESQLAEICKKFTELKGAVRGRAEANVELTRLRALYAAHLRKIGAPPLPGMDSTSIQLELRSDTIETNNVVAQLSEVDESQENRNSMHLSL